jgi:hypothetical protein
VETDLHRIDRAPAAKKAIKTEEKINLSLKITPA